MRNALGYDNKCIVHILAQIHTSFHCFMEMGQIFRNKYIFNKKNFQVEIWKMVWTILHWTRHEIFSWKITCPCTMSQTRLTRLALLHIHYNMEIDLINNPPIHKASSEESGTGQYPV